MKKVFLLKLLLQSIFFILFHSVAVFSATAPYVVSGKVIDEETGVALAFVNIQIQGSHKGGMTDIDGFFYIEHKQAVEKLILSYVGYFTKEYEVPEQSQDLLIEMRRQTIYLAPIDIYPGENPAHRIIANTINNREKNNPESRESFSYTSYNKFIFTGEFLEKEPEPLPVPADSATLKIGQHLEDHHFLIMETVNQRLYRNPGLNNEKILASRVSGLENPLMALMVSQFQSFSFYNDFIRISEKEYLNPISGGSIGRYFFLLEDTILSDNDTTFIISFRPSKGRNFQGLQGVLYINSNGWAIQNVLAEPFPPDEDTRIRIQQKYELIDNQYWFPTQLLTDVEFFGITEPANFKVLGKGRSYIDDIRINIPLSRKDFKAATIEFSPESIIRNERFWNNYRNEPLSVKERNTYHKIDSLGSARNLDQTLERMEALFEGYWRTGIFDIDILELISHNKVEGFRPGFGVRTNERLSSLFSINSHIGYGFKDDLVKYGAGLKFFLYRPRELTFGLHYQYDRMEKGTSTFLEPQGLLSPKALRNFFLIDLDMVEQQKMWLGWRMFGNKINMRLQAQKEERKLDDDYVFKPDLDEPYAFIRLFNTFETNLMLNFGPAQKFVLTPSRLLTYGSYYPQYLLSVTKGWEEIGNGDFDYVKAEARIMHSFKIPLLGTQQWVVEGGFANGNLPWHKLYNAPATYRKFSISVPHNFATMRMDEFFSDQYLAIFFIHNFESLLWRTRNFSPKFLVLSNFAIGSIKNPERHFYVDLKSFPEGYFESGFAALDLIGSGFSSLGIEFMYRYGPYAFPSFADNFSLRLSYSILFE